MKRYIAGIIMLLTFGTLSWSQGIKESFDAKKSREELEIMRGILNTTLTFVARNAPRESARLRFNNLKAFYLTGQGAVFVIPVPGFYASGFGVGSGIGGGIGGGIAGGIAGGIPWDPADEDYSNRIADLSREVSELARQEALASLYLRQAAPAPPSAPEPPAPPVPPAPPAKAEKAPKAEKPAQADLSRQQEALRKELERVQDRAKKAREEAEANRQKFSQALAEVKNYLVETLANYGDSMTTVKPEEYVNLVLVSDEFDSQRTRSDVISARKSWITDYKAGRLALEAFKQKVVQYNE